MKKIGYTLLACIVIAIVLRLLWDTGGGGSDDAAGTATFRVDSGAGQQVPHTDLLASAEQRVDSERPLNTASPQTAASDGAEGNLVSRLLANCMYNAPYEDLKALSEQEVTTLMNYYKSLPTMRKRWETARVLAHQTDDRVLGLLMHSLTNEFRGQDVTDVGEGALLVTLPKLIGLVAHDSDVALALLREGTKEAFWNTRVDWLYVGEAPVPRLVNACIVGLATSGREEAWRDVVELKEGADTTYLARHSSAIVDAYFTHSLFERGGWAFAMTNGTVEQYFAWANTTEGAAICEWADSIRK